MIDMVGFAGSLLGYERNGRAAIAAEWGAKCRAEARALRMTKCHECSHCVEHPRGFPWCNLAGESVDPDGSVADSCCEGEWFE
jgi:hypothetical protein